MKNIVKNIDEILKDKPMHSGVFTVSDILESNIKIVIPEHQRKYTWKKTQLEKLIETSKSKDSNFFGSIIISVSNNTFYLQDGQQRITSIIGLINSSKQGKAKSVIQYQDENNIYTDYMKETILLEESNDSKPKLQNPFRWIPMFWKDKDPMDYVEDIKCSMINVIFINENSTPKINQHSIFLNLNNSGVSLTPYELIKTTILKDYSKASNSAYLKKMNEIEDNTINNHLNPLEVINYHLFMNGQDITTSKIYKNFISMQSEKNFDINSYLDEVKVISEQTKDKLTKTTDKKKCNSIEQYFDTLSKVLMNNIAPTVKQTLIPMVWFRINYNNNFNTKNHISKFRFIGSILMLVWLIEINKEDLKSKKEKPKDYYKFSGNTFRSSIIKSIKDNDRNGIQSSILGHTMAGKSISVKNIIWLFETLFSKNFGFFVKTASLLSEGPKMSLEHVFQFENGKRDDRKTAKIWNLCVIESAINDELSNQSKYKNVFDKINMYLSLNDNKCIYSEILKRNHNLGDTKTKLGIIKIITDTNIEFISHIFELHYDKNESIDYEFYLKECNKLKLK